jgi:hypothetical protein
MVDREKRLEAATLLQRLISSEITNDDFENTYPLNPNDPALAAIYHRVWHLWDDRFTHKISVEHGLTEDGPQLVTRCLKFLNSHLEYEWPPSSFKAPFYLVLLRLAVMQNRARRAEANEIRRLTSFGDVQVWPFLRGEDWNAVRDGEAAQ